eukprot:COSAG02_NODE_16353_length_1090_cov_1.655903_1_plen_169_part_00
MGRRRRTGTKKTERHAICVQGDECLSTRTRMYTGEPVSTAATPRLVPSHFTMAPRRGVPHANLYRSASVVAAGASVFFTTRARSFVLEILEILGIQFKCKVVFVVFGVSRGTEPRASGKHLLEFQRVSVNRNCAAIPVCAVDNFVLDFCVSLTFSYLFVVSESTALQV